jgi:F-type H+-transporting ATPase subunit b
MPIDWFTVVAQALNFLILVWLLKRFLYKPILHSIDQREKGIANRLAEAEAKKAKAQKEQDDFQQKNDAFDQERSLLLKKVTDEAAAARQRLLDEARKDADSLRAKRQEALRNEQRTLSQEVIRWTQKEVFDIARKTLSDLATASLEEQMSEAFVIRLRGLSGAAKQQLAAALKSPPHSARVCSAFALPPAQRSAIESAVKETFAADIQIQFETTAELIIGIELSANGQKVAWSIAEYLATLENGAGKLLHEDAKPTSNRDAKSIPKADVDVKPGPPRELKQESEPVGSVPKADH